MEIRLKETEIRAAVHAYIIAQGINLTGKQVDIQFTATRGEAGIIAEIDISTATEAAQVVGTNSTVVVRSAVAETKADPEVAPRTPRTNKAADLDVATISAAAQAADISEAADTAVKEVKEAAEAAAPKAPSLFS